MDGFLWERRKRRVEEGRKEGREGEKGERLKGKRKKERRGLTFTQLAWPPDTQSGSLR